MDNLLQAQIQKQAAMQNAAMQNAPLAYVSGGRDPSAAERPPLARIGDVAEEAERAVSYIEDFISRCRGAPLGAPLGNANAQAQLMPVPNGHFGQFDRLALAVGKLDALARELQTIG